MKAVLVGPVQQENLALQYLAAAALRAGHQAHLVGYSYRHDLDRAVEEVLALKPDLVGLGMAFQNNIADYMMFMQGVRARGFRGHLTCGGHVPTFCYRELLRDEPGLDTAVRHEAEETIVEMLDQLERGESPHDIAGLVWRSGDDIVMGPVRKPIVHLDALPIPRRSALPFTVGGLIVDFVITARGCVGECHYCSIAAFSSEGGVPFRLRKPEAVAAEIASQYHERGARVIFVQDDLFILPSERKAVERIERIRAELTRLDVGDVVFWIKGRPETLTDRVCRAAREMGAIHLFTGVENASEARLDYLGRTHLPVHNISAIERCLEHGITPSFNFMLFDPDCSLEDVEASIELAERYVDLPWNVCRTEVYSGTQLRERLAAEDRLEGDYRSYGYRMRDARAEAMFRILRVAFHERALAISSLLNRLISLSFARQLHEHFFPGQVTEGLSRDIRALTHAVRRDTLERLRSILQFARSEDPRDKKRLRAFAVSQALSIGSFDAPLRIKAGHLWLALHARGWQAMAERGIRVPDGGPDFRVAVGS
jgi:anaerobic magnesium-protoporphyrin IX monomethyl ester cyclase